MVFLAADCWSWMVSLWRTAARVSQAQHTGCSACSLYLLSVIPILVLFLRSRIPILLRTGYRVRRRNRVKCVLQEARSSLALTKVRLVCGTKASLSTTLQVLVVLSVHESTATDTVEHMYIVGVDSFVNVPCAQCPICRICPLSQVQ